MTQTFRAKLQGYDQPGTWTFLALPFDTQKAFGAKSRIPVKGTINGVAFRSSLMPRGNGSHFLVVNKSLQRAARAAPGDVVHVVLELDTAPREVQLPEDLARALQKAQAAAGAFGKLSYSHQKEYLDWVESAKRAETRQSRITRVVEMVMEGRSLKR